MFIKFKKTSADIPNCHKSLVYGLDLLLTVHVEFQELIKNLTQKSVSRENKNLVTFNTEELLTLIAKLYKHWEQVENARAVMVRHLIESNKN